MHTIKKVIIGLTGLIVLAFFVIIAVNAQKNDKGVTKSGTEVSQNILPCASNTKGSCCTGSKIANCCSAKSSGMNCDVANCKASKCDPTKCKVENCNPATCNEGQCDQTRYMKSCSGSSKQITCGPMNCNRDVIVAAR